MEQDSGRHDGRQLACIPSHTASLGSRPRPGAHGQRLLQTLLLLLGGGQGRQGAVDRTPPVHDLSALDPSRTKQTPKSQAALYGLQLSIKCAQTRPSQQARP